MQWLVDAMSNPATVRNSEQMEAVGMRLFAEAADYAAAHPSPDAELQAELDRRLEEYDWPAALELIRRIQSRCEERGDHAGACQQARHASGLLRLRGDPVGAREAARQATAAARRVPGMDVLVGMALETEVASVLGIGAAQEALELAEEAVKCMGTEDISASSRAGALVHRARCRLELDDRVGAEADLDEAWPPLARMADSAFLAGIQGSLGRWFAVRAQLHRQRGELSAAGEAQQAAVERSRAMLQAPQIGFDISGPRLARDLRDLAAILAEAGRTDEAAVAEEEYQALLRRLRLGSIPPTF